MRADLRALGGWTAVGILAVSFGLYGIALGPPDLRLAADPGGATPSGAVTEAGRAIYEAQCASCHNMIDPIGFALENFDAVGRWRHLEEGQPVDASGGLPDGSRFAGVAGLEAGLLDRPEVFAGALTEKLLTFALGRGVEHYDAPAVRKIVREAKSEDYRLSSILVGVTKSMPFTMRKSL